MNADGAPLQEIVVRQWAEIAARLGDRRAAFIDTAAVGAQRFGLADEASRARFLNLCFAFGPGFEARPEHEWALATLSDPRLTPAVRLHQLLHQAVTVLERQHGDATRLRAGDEAVLDVVEDHRRREGAEPPLVPRRACDLDVMQLSVLAGERLEYVRKDDAWQRLPVADGATPCVIDATRTMPDIVAVIAHAQPDRVTQLVVRQRQHASCGEHHPALRWIDDRGIARWHGHAALAVSWPVRPPPSALAQAVHLVEETSPAVGVLEVESCGIRDQGVPLGPQRTRVTVYAADQYLFRSRRVGGTSWQFGPENAQHLVPATGAACRLERNGTDLAHQRWTEGFDSGLRQALTSGLARLQVAWQQAAAAATLQAEEKVLSGRAELAWGWREGSGGLAAPPLMRFDADIDMGLEFSLELQGEVTQGPARARLQLRAAGREPLRFRARRDTDAAPLLPALLPARAWARWTFSASFEPLVSADGSLWVRLGPCSGALVAEAGLRPRLSGGSGWEFFLRMDVEPIMLPVTVHDPVLGQVRRTLALLPAMNLVDWSLG